MSETIKHWLDPVLLEPDLLLRQQGLEHCLTQPGNMDLLCKSEIPKFPVTREETIKFIDEILQIHQENPGYHLIDSPAHQSLLEDAREKPYYLLQYYYFDIVNSATSIMQTTDEHIRMVEERGFSTAELGSIEELNQLVANLPILEANRDSGFMPLTS